MKLKIDETLKVELAQAFNQLCDYNPETDTYDDCFTDVLAFIQKKLDQQKGELENQLT